MAGTLSVIHKPTNKWSKDNFVSNVGLVWRETQMSHQGQSQTCLLPSSPFRGPGTPAATEAQSEGPALHCCRGKIRI